MIYFLLLLVAWGSLFLPLPRWFSLLLSLAIVGAGCILLLFGLMGAYWSSHMMPSNAGAATSTWMTGGLLLLSRLVLLFRAAADLPAPPFE